MLECRAPGRAESCPHVAAAGSGQDWGPAMRLASLATSSKVRDRLARTLRQRSELVERGRDAVAQAAGAVRDAAPSREPVPSSGGGRKQTAVAVAVVAVVVVAVGTCAYIWWRHRREQEYARLLEPEPERPGPAPAASPEGEPEAPAVPEPVTAVRAEGANGHATSGATASAGEASPQARRARALRPNAGASSGVQLPSASAFAVPCTRTEIPSRASISSLPR